MDNAEFERKVQELKSRAVNRWDEILLSAGIDAAVLKDRDQGCPICRQGKDCFRYTDKFGEGNYFCHRCGPGGGIKLLQGVLGWDFAAVLKHLEKCVALPLMAKPSSAGPSEQGMKRLAQRIWSEARPVAVGDDVDRYLRGRGLHLEQYPRTLRCHPALGYFEKVDGKRKKLGEYPAMLGCVQGADGHAVTLHRTYLKDGRKALGSQSKKILSSGIQGAAVRLGDATDELCVTEGIENGLAVLLSTGKPVWAALSAGNLEQLWLPPHVRHVCIYGDNDADGQFDGQAAAFSLARRLCKEPQKAVVGDAAIVQVIGSRRLVKVFVPKRAGTDWNDVLIERLAREVRAA